MDDNTFKFWSYEVISNLLYYESEYQPLTGETNLYDEVVMQLPGSETLEDQAFINKRNTNVNQVPVGLICF